MFQDSVNQQNISRSGKRRNKKVKSLHPTDVPVYQENNKRFKDNDNQEKTIGFEDNEYRWPESLSDEEYEHHNRIGESKT